MLKLLKNNYLICAITLISSILTTTLICVKSSMILNLSSFLLNELIVLVTIVVVVFCEGIFLISTDSLFCRKKSFKDRFFYVMKSIWISQFVLLPIILILFVVNFFVELDISIINKIIVVSISYLGQLVLFFSYKFITKYDWNTTIKVVASQSVLTIFLTLLLKFI